MAEVETEPIFTPLPLSEGGFSVSVTDRVLGIDTRVFQKVLSRVVATPPTAPSDGDVYLVGSSPTSLWVTRAGYLALYSGFAWRFYRPKAGWKTWIIDEGLLLVFNGTTWQIVGGIIENRTDDPVSPDSGRIWLRTDL